MHLIDNYIPAPPNNWAPLGGVLRSHVKFRRLSLSLTFSSVLDGMILHVNGKSSAQSNFRNSRPSPWAEEQKEKKDSYSEEDAR